MLQSDVTLALFNIKCLISYVIVMTDNSVIKQLPVIIITDTTLQHDIKLKYGMNFYDINTVVSVMTSSFTILLYFRGV